MPFLPVTKITKIYIYSNEKLMQHIHRSSSNFSARSTASCSSDRSGRGLEAAGRACSETAREASVTPISSNISPISMSWLALTRWPRSHWPAGSLESLLSLGITNNQVAVPWKKWNLDREELPWAGCLSDPSQDIERHFMTSWKNYMKNS